MREILKFDKLPENYTSNYLGSGENGSTYRIDDENVFKTFKNPSYYEPNVLSLYRHIMDSFVLPEKLVYINDEFIGYIMPYIDGKTLNNIDGLLSIRDYIVSLKKLEYDLAALSTHKFFIIDFKDQNILLTNNGELKVIDTDLYTKTDYIKGLYSYNLSNLSYAILKPFINLFIDGINDKRLNHYRNLLIEGRMLPSRFLEEVVGKYNLEDGNISEVQEQVKLILK